VAIGVETGDRSEDIPMEQKNAHWGTSDKFSIDTTNVMKTHPKKHSNVAAVTDSGAMWSPSKRLLGTGTT
jgi:hypothetical protein